MPYLGLACERLREHSERFECRRATLSTHILTSDGACRRRSQTATTGPKKLPKPKRAFACWFHTHFVENGRLRLAKCELDKACKDKKVSSDLRVSIKFHRVTGPRTWRPPPRSKRAPSPNNVVP